MASMRPAPASRHRQSISTNLPRVDCSPWRSGHLRSSRSPSRVRSNLAGKGAMGMASLSLPIPLRSNLASAPMPFFKPFGRNFPQYPPPKKPPAHNGRFRLFGKCIALCLLFEVAVHKADHAKACEPDRDKADIGNHVVPRQVGEQPGQEACPSASPGKALRRLCRPESARKILSLPRFRLGKRAKVC